MSDARTLAALVAGLLVAGCAGEVRWSPPATNGPGGTGGQGGSAAGGDTGGGEPTDCDGCLTVWQDINGPQSYLVDPCPGAMEQYEQVEGCLCAQCSSVCGFCQDEPTPDPEACQQCITENTGPCDELAEACAADTRKSSHWPG